MTDRETWQQSGWGGTLRAMHEMSPPRPQRLAACRQTTAQGSVCDRDCKEEGCMGYSGEFAGCRVCYPRAFKVSHIAVLKKISAYL